MEGKDQTTRPTHPDHGGEPDADSALKEAAAYAQDRSKSGLRVLFTNILCNFLLFAGKQAADLLPNALRRAPARAKWQRKGNSGPVRPVAAQPQARFRCTVCGRTELTDPRLEFRYCSKCKGYRCYCEDHIHNHAHITE